MVRTVAGLTRERGRRRMVARFHRSDWNCLRRRIATPGQ